MMELTIASSTSLHSGIRSAADLSPVVSWCSRSKLSSTFTTHTGFLKVESTWGRRVLISKSRNNKSILVRASASNEESMSWVAPFQPESPTGQYLSQLLKSHPHLLPAAIEQELERLSENKSDKSAGEMKSEVDGSELVLYRRIAELKEQERRTKLEEIIYTLIVQKFVESGISMVPNLMSITSIEKPWPLQVKELEAVHSVDVQDMIKQHMTLVLGGQSGDEYLDRSTYAQISKLRGGQVYAASIIYGYFLRRIYQRFRLEKSMKLLPPGSGEQSTKGAEKAGVSSDSGAHQEQMAATMDVLRGLGVAGPMQFSGMKPTALQSYIASMDVEMLQRIATVRSRESLRVLEKHTEALFGRPDIIISPDGSMRVNKDELLKISFAGLRHLVLEAIAFGSFLWDVESHVDASYAFVTN